MSQYPSKRNQRSWLLFRTLTKIFGQRSSKEYHVRLIKCAKSCVEGKVEAIFKYGAAPCKNFIFYCELEELLSFKEVTDRMVAASQLVLSKTLKQYRTRIEQAIR